MSRTTAELTTMQSYLDELQAERDATWSEAELREHVLNRQAIDEAADPSRYVKVGDRLDPFTLDEVDGGTVDLDDLLERGPVVILAFRFEACPACNAALRGYQATLAGPLADLGASVVAVSAQVPDRLGAIKQRHGLEFLVASDPRAKLIKSLGIGFEPDEAGRQQIIAKGYDVGEILGTGDWTLAYPAAIVVDSGRVVRFVDVHPNWMVRTPDVTILEEVRKLAARAVRRSGGRGDTGRRDRVTAFRLA